MTDCLFCKIISGTLPSKKVYEDEHIIAIHDIYPKAATHVLVLPRKHIGDFWDIGAADKELLGYITLKLPEIAQGLGLDGFRTIVNTGASSGQEIFHLHYHILGGSPRLPGF